MLLDRKKINRMTRWGAIILALLFLLSFVLMGVGSGTGLNVFAGCSKGSISSNSSFSDKEKYYLDQLEENPEDTDAMLALVALYSDNSIGRYEDAISYLEKYLELNPSDIDARLRIAAIYINDLSDPQSAIPVLMEATSAAPDNAQAFYLLGLAQRDAGQNQAAIVTWGHYLEMAPDSANADIIRQEIERLKTLPATTPQQQTIPGVEGVKTEEVPTP